MDFDTVFPHKYLLNLSRRPDRRVRCEELFAEQGWKVRRQPAIDARWLKSAHGFQAPGRYAHALSTRMVLRRAMLTKAETVFIFEDDVVLHPALAERLAEIELPDDWGIFYLGCQHYERPDVVSPGLVRARAPLDTHAWGVRAEYFFEVRRALAGRYWPHACKPAADILLAELTRRVPAYAAWPNLVWQQEEQSDLAGGVYANYDPDGSQYHARGCMLGLLPETLGGKAHPPSKHSALQERAWFWPAEWHRPADPVIVNDAPALPLGDGDKVAFLFLTRGQHLHPDIWEEYWNGDESRVTIYGHAKERGWTVPAGGRDWLGQSQIDEHIPTAWGDVSLARAQMALLKAALREPDNRFFIFASESCLPVRPLRDLLRLLTIDGRSRFCFETLAQVEEINPQKAARPSATGRIAPGQWRFHSQWILLNREAAELLAANEALLDCFECIHPDESAFGTILHVAGYPLAKKVAARDVTWKRWATPYSANPDTLDSIPAETMGDIAASGCFFARKFAVSSNVADFGLHLHLKP